MSCLCQARVGTRAEQTGRLFHNDHCFCVDIPDIPQYQINSGIKDNQASRMECEATTHRAASSTLSSSAGLLARSEFSGQWPALIHTNWTFHRICTWRLAPKNLFNVRANWFGHLRSHIKLLRVIISGQQCMCERGLRLCSLCWHFHSRAVT